MAILSAVKVFIWYNFSESSKYTEESLSEALALQNSMDANMGGTEIYRPLRNIFSKNTIKGHPRQVLPIVY